ncbi:hypothetical protein BKA82DRAFT_948413 [Pisolithus tinctorius]|nr:hypothetical protein BKA82DRAFT_948413 [Pisolithus tinctorius]
MVDLCWGVWVRRILATSGVIVMMAQLLSLGLGRIKQPKVIAEVLGGFLLGRSDGFRNSIRGFTRYNFPEDSLPYLSLVANIGLCRFLFLVGLEIDVSIVKRNARLSTVVSLAGIALPFGLGWALSLLLYHHFTDPSVQFTHFMLFTGVAYCPLRPSPVMLWLARKTGSVENGPTVFHMTVVILLLWRFAFFTDIAGMAWQFTSNWRWGAGALLVGIVVPREGGLAITLTEKLEDMVSIVFLPLVAQQWYNVGLHDRDHLLSFTGKFGGCTLAAKLSGFGWRDRLVEPIVLNVGLEAGILSQTVFSMLVLEAVMLTFLTTPLVSALYPPERRARVSGQPVQSYEDGTESVDSIPPTEDGPWRYRFTVVLDKLGHVPGVMALTQLILPAPSSIFRMFGELDNLAVSTSLSVVPFDDFSHRFIRGVFVQNKSDVAVFIDTGDRSGAGGSQHVFFGGPDDRLSLEFVVQLCLNPRITATVTAFPDTVYSQPNTQTRMQSETADSMTWSKYASLNPDPDTPSLLRAALSRTRFSEFSMPTPLRAAIQRAATIGQTHTRPMIVAGRSKRLATESHHHELKEIFVEYGTSGEVMRKTIGDVASAMVVSNSASALVVLQTAIPVEFKGHAV